MHVEGRFDAPAVLAGTSLQPHQVRREGELGLPGSPKEPHERSGLKLIVSAAGSLAQQVEAATHFLEENAGDLQRVLSAQGVEHASLDFGHCCRLHEAGTAIQCDVLPARLLRHCGALGVAVELSLYPSRPCPQRYRSGSTGALRPTPKAKAEARAALRFFGADLDPSDVTRRLVLPPDTAFRRGDLRILRSTKGKVRLHSPYSAGIWSMSSGEWVHGANLGTHITWLLDQIEPKREEVARLLAEGHKGDIFCFWCAAHDPNIPKAVRERAASYGLEIAVDTYRPMA